MDTNPKKPWPTKQVMNQIYDKNLWGGDEKKFYSGEGSHLPEITKPYIQVVATFLKSFQNPLSVYDLGCGDFNIGKELVHFTDKYIAIDIVEDLINQNKIEFVADNLSFYCLDLAKDEIPIGDCAIIRQVLQHLSNVEVQNILEKISQFKYIILTEHIPAFDFIPNLDIISSQGTRLKKQSGIDISSHPFNFSFKSKMEMLSIILKDGKSKILTVLYKL